MEAATAIAYESGVNVTRTRTLAIGLLLLLAVMLTGCPGAKPPVQGGAVWDQSTWDGADWQ
jgi:hypothetical protein